MTNLAQAIASAHESNERTLASQIAAPKPELPDVLTLIKRFADWCKSKGVPFCPAQPATVCAHLRETNSADAFATAQAIEAMHDQAMVANPCATMVVRTELARILKDDPPRSWARVHHPLWASLPIECKEVIRNYADLATKAVRKAQNEAAELRHKLKSFEQTKGLSENELRQEES